MTTDKYPAKRDALLTAMKAVLDDLATQPSIETPPPVTPPVVPPVAGKWPNAPGWPLLLDAPGNARSEWSDVLWNDQKPGEHVTWEKDPTAPFSPPGVMNFAYPTGYISGHAPGTPVQYFPKPVRQIYCAAVLKFSKGWQGHGPSGVSKILYPFTANNGSIFLCLYGPVEGPFELRMYPQFLVQQGAVTPKPLRLDSYGNDAWLKNGWLLSNNNVLQYVPGSWLTVEVKIDLSVFPSVTQWFANGKLQGHYLGVTFPPEGFSEFHMAPVWGGMDDIKKQDDSLLVDHVRIEGK